MLSDRSYLRSHYSRPATSVLVWLVASLVAAYLLELVLAAPWSGPGPGADLVNELSLTVRSLQSGHAWTLLTHPFLHSPTNPGHLLLTILGVIFLGRELEPLLGPRRFLAVFAGALVLGALGWCAVHWVQGGLHIGASAGVFGLFVVLACVYPDQELTFLLFFLVPVTLRPRHLVLGLLVLDAIGLVFFEMSGTWTNYAPSAHLGGMCAGWIYFRYFHANNGWDRAASFGWPLQLRRPQPPAGVLPPKGGPNRSPTAFRAEVDRILDKINSEGFGALTEEEKRLLDEAKDLLSRP